MMAARVFLIFLVVALPRCQCDHSTAYSSTVGSGQFGELLKPPPPPLAQIQPMPFHGGASRAQRQNADFGYGYQPPPPPPPTQQISQIPFPSDFKFPAPFYKQYNFNFVPPPQPFTTTPSPSLFQKVSTWLFPSQQTGYDSSSGLQNNLGQIKKDCNPCNLVPWIPVLRYNVGAKNIYHSNNPTYGPPSPTALAENVAKFQPQSFLQQNGNQKPPHLLPGIPHAVYGPPASTFNSYSNAGGAISSTYGPPSPTHTIPSQNPISSTFIASSSPYSVPSSTYGAPSSSIGQPSSSYLPSYNKGVSISSFNSPTSTYRPPTLYTTPSASFQSPYPVTTYGPPVTQPPYYEPGTLNNDLPPQNEFDILSESGPSEEQQLPNVAQPTGFRNSYGELITNTYKLDPYPVSATAAESTKVKTQVLPNENFSGVPNQSLSLANPAPFTLNRGRNIHTLQPVALPNLSVSPLPPIFNARPFRPIASPFPPNVLHGINQMQQKPNNVDIKQSVPLVEFTHSVDYPATYIQSPVIDIESLRNNQTKAYRNIPNHFVIDEIRDISSQASEDHISATKTIPESSFESTGVEIGNDIYDTLPADLNSNSYASNHKTNFADLRGLKDEDVDKYRTESNLQNIDSPLLYLKPSAPHKSFGNFIFAVSTPVNNNEFELYDDVPNTTSPPLQPTLTAWDESRNDYSESLSPSPVPLQSNTHHPKIVQIIVPYTTGKKADQNSGYPQESQQWADVSDEKHQARKVPSNTDSPYMTFTENYSTAATTTEDSLPTVTESYDERLTSAAILNDLYDVKEPPFDIVKLQHTIDGWTEQEYSKYKPPQRTRSSEKYAKKIPDEYFTTTIPTNFVTETDNYYDLFDHEGSSSIQHAVTDKNDEEYRPREYNTIERTKNRYNSAKNEEQEEIQKLHIYTAASSFRDTTTRATTTTTTPAPWGKIQTSISPLTKEKVYVVTSKPWRDIRNVTKDWYDVDSFESKKTFGDNSKYETFKSPRFMHRPSFGFTSGGKVESAKSDSGYGFSRSWYQSINELETKNNSTTPEDPRQRVSTSSSEIKDSSNRHRYK